MIAKKPKMIVGSAVAVILVIAAAVLLTFTTSAKEMPADIGYDTNSPIEPKPAEAEADTPLGINGVFLDYASDTTVIFHDYFGLFVYNPAARQLMRTLNLKDIGCDMTQGSDYCEVIVSEDGNTIYLHPLSKESMYIYKVAENQLYESDYQKPENTFQGIVPFAEAVPELTEIQGSSSYEAVKRTAEDNSTYYSYLTYTEGTAGSIRYIDGTDTHVIFQEQQEAPTADIRIEGSDQPFTYSSLYSEYQKNADLTADDFTGLVSSGYIHTAEIGERLVIELKQTENKAAPASWEVYDYWLKEDGDFQNLNFDNLPPIVEEKEQTNTINFEIEHNIVSLLSSQMIEDPILRGIKAICTWEDGSQEAYYFVLQTPMW